MHFYAGFMHLLHYLRGFYAVFSTLCWQIEEQLSEEERKAAWNEYQVEKERAAAGLPATGPAFTNPSQEHITPFNLPVSAYANAFLSERERQDLVLKLRKRVSHVCVSACMCACLCSTGARGIYPGLDFECTN